MLTITPPVNAINHLRHDGNACSMSTMMELSASHVQKTVLKDHVHGEAAVIYARTKSVIVEMYLMISMTAQIALRRVTPKVMVHLHCHALVVLDTAE